MRTFRTRQRRTGVGFVATRRRRIVTRRLFAGLQTELHVRDVRHVAAAVGRRHQSHTSDHVHAGERVDVGARSALDDDHRVERAGAWQVEPAHGLLVGQGERDTAQGLGADRRRLELDARSPARALRIA